TSRTTPVCLVLLWFDDAGVGAGKRLCQDCEIPSRRSDQNTKDNSRQGGRYPPRFKNILFRLPDRPSVIADGYFIGDVTDRLRRHALRCRIYSRNHLSTGTRRRWNGISAAYGRRTNGKLMGSSSTQN